MKYDIFEIPDPKHPGKKIQHLRIVGANRMSKDAFLYARPHAIHAMSADVKGVTWGVTSMPRSHPAQSLCLSAFQG